MYLILEILASRALRFTVIPRALVLFSFPLFHFHLIVSNVANCKIKLKTKKNHIGNLTYFNTTICDLDSNKQGNFGSSSTIVLVLLNARGVSLN